MGLVLLKSWSCVKNEVFTVVVCRHTGDNKTLTIINWKCLYGQQLNDWLPNNRKINGLGIFILPLDRKKGLETKWGEVVPRKTVWDKAFWNTRNKQTGKGGMTELQSFEDGDNFNLMQTSVHVLCIEIIKHLHFHVCVPACKFLCFNEFSGCTLQDGYVRAWCGIIICML